MLALLLVTCGLIGADARLEIASDFPGGSAEVVRISAEERLIHIRPALQPGRGWPCWWYFRAEGLQAAEEYTLQVSAQPGEYREGSVLAANWALPQQAAVSEDGKTWQQTPAGKIAGKTATYRIKATKPTMWFAWGPPFVPSDADALLKELAEKLPGSKRFVLAKTLGERNVEGIRLGDGPAAIWVNARQHAWESGGSWVGAGFARWVAGDDPAAKELRARATITFIPIMDVDNAATGAGGKEAEPRDHNRDWGDKPTYPEVAAAQQEIKALHEAGKLRMYLDLHNPGAADKQPYFYGPFDLEKQPAHFQQRYHRWHAIAREEIADPLPLFKEYRFATYIQTEEERQRMSSHWVRMNTSPDILAMTLETSWNTPHSTADGYQKVGAGLARAVARYLADSEKK